MADSRVTVPVAQFAQQLKQKLPQFSSISDAELVAAFVSTNPQCSVNYEGAKGLHSRIGDAECVQPRHGILTAQFNNL
jgi:hypothetical protein